MHVVAVALGGALGTLLRLVLTSGSSGGAEWDPRISVVNVAGAFLLGMLARLPVRPRLRSLLGPGFLGAFTSFSALSIALVDGSAATAVALGLAVSLGLGVVAAALGYWLGGLVAPDEEAGA